MQTENIQAREIIEDLQEKYIEKTPLEVRESLSGHSDVVQMNFAASYFPLEFIQNADDENSTAIRFLLREADGSPRLEILNNGREFTEPEVADGNQEVKSDVRGICKAGQSPKEPRNHIGFIGVGFKSIFEISERVEIHSGPFHFEFNRNLTEATNDEESDLPWRVIPWWNDSGHRARIPADIEDMRYTTRFVIHLDEERISEDLYDGDTFSPLSVENLDRRVFLFLKNLQEIVIDDELSGNRRVLRRDAESGISDTLQDNVAAAKESYPRTVDDLNGIEPVKTISVTEERNGETERDTWVVFSDRWKVPTKVRDDQKTKEYFRRGVESREIFIGLLANETGELVSPGRAGTLHSGVFSYLPLKEIDADFEFLVHADFLTPSDRQSIKRDVLWNQEIAKAVAECLIDVIDSIAHHEVWWKHLDLLTPGKKGDEFISSYIQEPVWEYFENEKIVRDADGKLAGLGDVQRASQDVVDIFTVSQFNEIKKNRPLHPKHESIYSSAHPTSSRAEINDVLSDSRAAPVISEMGKEPGASDIFSQIYQSLAKQPRYRQRTALESTGVLLDDGRVVGTKTADNLYVQTEDRSFDQFDADPLTEVEEELDVVNRAVLELDQDDEIMGVFENIGITEITNAEIVSIWVASTPWEDKTENDRRAAARSCKEGVLAEDIEGEDISGLKLRTKESDEWLDPESLLLPREMEPIDPAHLIEKMKSGWLQILTPDERQQVYSEAGLPIQNGILRFVDPSYIDDRSDETVDEWRSFLYSIGVDALVRDDDFKKQFIGCLGELYVKHILSEHRDGTSAENVKVGRDIQTVSDVIGTPEKIIEVKSTDEETNAFDLSVAQTSVLTNNREKYWVYGVTKVLTNPMIQRAHGEEVLREGETTIKVSSGIWENIAAVSE